MENLSKDTLKAHARVIDAKLDELKAKAKVAKAEAQAEAQTRLNELLNKRESLEQEMQALSEKGQEASAEIESGVTAALDELTTAVDDALAELTS